MNLLQLKTNPIGINLIQIYAPTAETPGDDVEYFYGNLQRLLQLTQRSEIIVTMGDFNAKVKMKESMINFVNMD